jgi:hypothetical protein
MIECRVIEIQNIIIEGFHNIWFNFSVRKDYGTYPHSSLSIDEENQGENEEDEEDDYYIDDVKPVCCSQDG